MMFGLSKREQLERAIQNANQQFEHLQVLRDPSNGHSAKTVKTAEKNFMVTVGAIERRKGQLVLKNSATLQTLIDARDLLLNRNIMNNTDPNIGYREKLSHIKSLTKLCRLILKNPTVKTLLTAAEIQLIRETAEKYINSLPLHTSDSIIHRAIQALQQVLSIRTFPNPLYEANTASTPTQSRSPHYAEPDQSPALHHRHHQGDGRYDALPTGHQDDGQYDALPTDHQDDGGYAELTAPYWRIGKRDQKEFMSHPWDLRKPVLSAAQNLPLATRAIRMTTHYASLPAMPHGVSVPGMLGDPTVIRSRGYPSGLDFRSAATPGMISSGPSSKKPTDHGYDSTLSSRRG